MHCFSAEGLHFSALVYIVVVFLHHWLVVVFLIFMVIIITQSLIPYDHPGRDTQLVFNVFGSYKYTDHLLALDSCRPDHPVQLPVLFLL